MKITKYFIYILIIIYFTIISHNLFINNYELFKIKFFNKYLVDSIVIKNNHIDLLKNNLKIYLRSLYSNKIDSIKYIYTNSAEYKLKKIYNSEKTAGVIFDNYFKIYEQNDTQKIIKEFNTLNLINDLVAFQPIKQFFLYKNNYIGLLSFKTNNKFHIKIINFTKKFIIFQSPNLPSGEVDFNGIGGGFTNYNNNLLFAIGTPSANYKDSISLLGQDMKSPFGKILIFSDFEILNGPANYHKFKIFSSGHRNPQAMLFLNNTIYEIEHGPRGGDEFNIIKYKKNYGWPLYSFGVSYEGHKYTIPIDSNSYAKPIYFFLPSIAPSDLILCPSEFASKFKPYTCLLMSTLKEKSLYILILDSSNRIIGTEKIDIGFRVREMFILDNKLCISTDGFGIYELTKIKDY